MTAALVCVFLWMQSPQPTKPPTASIEGYVRRAGTGEPVFKARVVLSGGSVNTGYATGGPVAVARLSVVPAGPTGGPTTATTDRTGHFVFAGLEAGRYTLLAYANDYVRQGYRQREPNVPPTPIILSAGQQFKDVVLEMTPTGTVSGRIFDEDNMPLVNADVALEGLAYDNDGQRTPRVAQQVRTNDLGEYRLYWVTPGKYFLRADFNGAPMPMMQTPNQFMGPGNDNYAPVYYPGTADISSATQIEILPGTQMNAMDITLVRTRTYTIKGRAIVTAANAANVRPSVFLRPRRPVGPFMSGMNTRMNPDGTFEIANVVPGSYILQGNAGNGPNVMLHAEVPIDVNGDMDGVVVTLSPGFDVPFRITFEGGSSPSSGTSKDVNPLTNMRPALRPFQEGSGFMIGGGAMPQAVKPDGTFTISNVTPGVYQIQLFPLPSPDYYIKAVNSGHTDALHEGIALDRTPDTPIEILLSSNAGKIEGRVVDRDGKPATSIQVTLIPNDRARAERFKLAATDTNGHFEFHGIYPGDYKLFAWDGVEPNAYRDPDFLRAYEAQGKGAPISEGANGGVELQVIKLSP